MRVAFGDLAYEPIALAWHGGDVPIRSWRLPENLAQRRNILREAVLFDDHPGPDRAQERVLVERFPTALDQEEQRIEVLGRQRNGFPARAPRQTTLAAVENEVAELVNGALIGIHTPIQEASVFFSDRPRTFTPCKPTLTPERRVTRRSG